MKILNTISLGWNNVLNPTAILAQKPTTLAGKQPILPWKLKATSRMRLDIKNWNVAINMLNSDEPKTYLLQQLYTEILYDALLTSQIENRVNKCLASEFSLVNSSGEIDLEQTKLLRKLPAFRNITREILNSSYFGYSVLEMSLKKQQDNTFSVEITPIPRTNIVPSKGRFYPDYTEDKFILYRDLTEFGTYILEFNSSELGLLNKAVPHVLMKRFAQSCWSELCEIYGIPPRVMKTNTQDPEMLARAEDMMRDTGAAAWYIIDEHEKFEWAKGTDTNGDVYKNLISLCSNETSMLISGAIIGQDTVNGSNSKEVASQQVLEDLVKSDKDYVEQCWNYTVLPALVKLGLIKQGLTFQFDAVEDLGELWTRTKETFQYMNVNPVFVKEKFGVDVLSAKENTGTNPKLSLDSDFFV